MHKVKISNKEKSSYGNMRIWLDNMELEGVVSYRMEVRVGEPTCISLDLLVDGVETVVPYKNEKISRFELIDIEKE